MRVIVIVLCLLSFFVRLNGKNHRNKPSFFKHYNKALESLKQDDFIQCLAHLERAMAEDASSIEGNQLYGALMLKNGRFEEAELHLGRAVEMIGWSDPMILANYIEAVRSTGNLQRAIVVGERAIKSHPAQTQILFNLAVVYAEAKMYSEAYVYFVKATEADVTFFDSWRRCAEMLLEIDQLVVAEKFLRAAVKIFANNHLLPYMLGAVVHKQNRFEEALTWYAVALKAKPDYYPAHSNIGAAYQSLGRANSALEVYEYILPLMPEDAGLRNNYGALLGIMNRKDEEIFWLLEALKLDPYMENVLINLSGYYQDEGMQQEAGHYLVQAMNVSSKSNLLRLRLAVLLSPVSSSWSQMNAERNNVEMQVIELQSSFNTTTKSLLDSSLDRIHFYIQYHGLNDRYMQELIVNAYHANIEGLRHYAPNLMSSDTSIISLRKDTKNLADYHVIKQQKAPSDSPIAPSSQRKVRVGFFSKFFGLFEPHGLLLDGTMKYLPRSQFEVIALPVARTDGKPLAFTVADGADFVVEISLSHEYAYEQLAQLDLDILVFADVMSEPMAHFIAHARIARIQVWIEKIGIPETENIEYFTSFFA